jgi:hypothetical protein
MSALKTALQSHCNDAFWTLDTPKLVSVVANKSIYWKVSPCGARIARLLHADAKPGS